MDGWAATPQAQLSSVTAYEYSSEDWQSICLSLEVCVPAGVIMLLVFECMKGTRPVYWPKRRWKRSQTPRRFAAGFLAWLADDMLTPGDALCDVAGVAGATRASSARSSATRCTSTRP